MIIDVHVHMGWDYSFDEDFKLEYLINKKDKHNVVQIVQPGTCYEIDLARKQHDEISKLCQNYPGHFYGMANPNPTLGKKCYMDEIDRCIGDLRFIAIKLNPMVSGINPDSETGKKVFEAAKKYNVPVMVHTGAGFPFANPLNLLNVAKKYPELRIIMAHMGQIFFSKEADIVLENCPNVYGDTSWTPGFLLKSFIEKNGNRLMLGSDHADNFEVEMVKIENAFSSEQKNYILSKTAKEIFKLNQ